MIPQSSFLMVGNSSLITPLSISSPSYSIAFWDNMEEYNPFFTSLVDLGDKTNGNDAGYIGTGAYNPYCGINQLARFIYDAQGGCNNILMTPQNTIQLRKWNHTTITRNSLGYTKLYINGLLIDSSNSLDYSAYSSLSFGGGHVGAGLKGRLDDIFIFIIDDWNWYEHNHQTHRRIPND
jgi:hypothetical protein